MEEKINVAELLKDCPKGMELDCMMYENVELDFIEQNPESIYPIHCLLKLNGGCNTLVFTHNGCSDRHPNAKCVIFPKGKTTWKGFVPPCKFKDGDIVTNILGVVAIYKEITTCGYCGSFASLDHYNQFIPHYQSYLKDCIRLSTEEEKEKLFDAIKANGYRWNAETKTLEKFVEPKFKVGNKVKRKDVDYTFTVTIAKLDGDYYDYVNEDGQCGVIYISKQDEWELVPNKFDINTLKPFESRVLVRDSTKGIWYPEFFGCLCDSNDCSYMVVGGNRWKYCIPFEGNKHLLCTTDDCDEYYKTWE